MIGGAESPAEANHVLNVSETIEVVKSRATRTNDVFEYKQVDATNKTRLRSPERRGIIERRESKRGAGRLEARGRLDS